MIDPPHPEDEIRQLRADVDRLTKERDEALADGVLSQRVCDIENDNAQLRATIATLEAERDAARNMCVCIECGRCKIDEDGCCTTCGRDALLLEDGRLINRDFANNLEADVKRRHVSAGGESAL